MTSLKAISKELSNMSDAMRKGAKRALYAEGQVIMSEFQARSPVDTGTYRSRWRLSRDRFATGNKVSGITIYNNTSHAYWMEEGAEPGQAPWHFNKDSKRSGKLKVVNGRVWAGGLSPGHSKTVGGAIGPALLNNNRRQIMLANAIANGIIGAIR